MRMPGPNNIQSGKNDERGEYDDNFKHELISAQQTAPQWVIRLQLPLL